MSAQNPPLKLAFDLDFKDLYDREGLVRLDAQFIRFLKDFDADLHSVLVKLRLKAQMAGRLPSEDDLSTLCIELAPVIEVFLIQLFAIAETSAELTQKVRELAPRYQFKRTFIQRKALKKINKNSPFPGDIETWFEDEEDFYKQASAALEKDENLDQYLEYAAYRSYHAPTENGQPSFFFTHPKKVDLEALIPVEEVLDNGVNSLKSNSFRGREGFALTDEGASLPEAVNEMHYCLKCHQRGKDTCRTGMHKKEDTEAPENARVPLENALKNPLTGCPLDQKISEMHLMAEVGHMIGALAIITLDNPMVAATGHRICTECKDACIFQTQTPVDTPQAETRILKEVLALPWGFEIYSLLTRWTPLDVKTPFPKPDSDYNVLVVGMGPAGFTLAHYLLNQGHMVTGVDGLKIEALDVPFQPIYDTARLFEGLEARPLYGFGGVAEYGITSRWDKNFLTLIRLILQRQSQFHLLDGVRFGGALSIDSAFQMGFDHIALCTGAGKPEIPDIPGNLSKGVRAASDFLMALQLTGAARPDSLSNLQIRLPVVVVGGGLTAVDTATEALAYYPAQVEKMLARFEALEKDAPEEIRPHFPDEDRAVLDEMLDHARQLRGAKTPGEKMALLNKWGGVKVAYRKDLTAAPSYRLNHHEVAKALEEGIEICPDLTPTEILTDETDHVCAIKFKEGKTLPARTILMAAGTRPNTVIAREEPDKIRFDANGPKDQNGDPLFFERLEGSDFFVHQGTLGRMVSFFGDLHPDYHGKVVKAMASAKKGAAVIDQHLEQFPPRTENIARKLLDFQPVVESVEGKGFVTHLTIKAAAAAAAWQPGQFFRLQNYLSSTAPLVEGIAIDPVSVDVTAGTLSFHVYEAGASTAQLKHLQKGERVVLMGPTGTPLSIDKDAKIYVPDNYWKERVVAAYNDLTLVETPEEADQILLAAPAHHLPRLAEELPAHKPAFAMVYAPMQCMMKEVCAQCITKLTDGSVAFACNRQFLPLRSIDIKALQQRVRQNSVQETLTRLWVEKGSTSDNSSN